LVKNISLKIFLKALQEFLVISKEEVFGKKPSIFGFEETKIYTSRCILTKSICYRMEDHDSAAYYDM